MSGRGSEQMTQGPRVAARGVPVLRSRRAPLPLCSRGWHLWPRRGRGRTGRLVGGRSWPAGLSLGKWPESVHQSSCFGWRSLGEGGAEEARAQPIRPHPHPSSRRTQTNLAPLRVPQNLGGRRVSHRPAPLPQTPACACLLWLPPRAPVGTGVHRPLHPPPLPSAQGVTSRPRAR